jgi:hypothetical protein
MDIEQPMRPQRRREPYEGPPYAGVAHEIASIIDETLEREVIRILRVSTSVSTMRTL